MSVGGATHASRRNVALEQSVGFGLNARALSQLEFIMLSSRQREVMLLVAEGLSNKEIARRLEISDGTVKVHLHCICEKLGIRNRTMLALAASSEIQMMVIDPVP